MACCQRGARGLPGRRRAQLQWILEPAASSAAPSRVSPRMREGSSRRSSRISCSCARDSGVACRGHLAAQPKSPAVVHDRRVIASPDFRPRAVMTLRGWDIAPQPEPYSGLSRNVLPDEPSAAAAGRFPDRAGSTIRQMRRRRLSRNHPPPHAGALDREFSDEAMWCGTAFILGDRVKPVASRFHCEAQLRNLESKGRRGLADVVNIGKPDGNSARNILRAEVGGKELPLRCAQSRRPQLIGHSCCVVEVSPQGHPAQPIIERLRPRERC